MVQFPSFRLLGFKVQRSEVQGSTVIVMLGARRL